MDDSSGLQNSTQSLDINKERNTPVRKKKTRHVLDASLKDTTSQGFSAGQSATQGVFTTEDSAKQSQGEYGRASSSMAQSSQQHNIQHINQPLTDQGPRQMEAGHFPSIVDDLEELNSFYHNNVFRTNQIGNLNPPAYVDFTAIDAGTSNPRYARLSMGSVPATDELLAASQLPLSLIIQPLAERKPDEEEVPLVDCKQNPPIRCRRCRSYMNPAMRFISGGNRFICNICNFSNETPAEYYSPADERGYRQDIGYRPELQFGTCDFEVGSEYWFKEKAPSPVRILFAIDVSEQAIIRGVPRAACAAISKALYGSEGEALPSNLQVGFLTFDRACHFYDLRCETTSMTRMLCVNDIDDMFVPMKEGLFADVVSSKEVISTVLDSISTIFESERVPEPAVGAMSRAAYLALQDSGGKLCLFLGALGTWGPGKLKMRENSALYNTTDEKSLFEANTVHWKNVSEEFVSIGVGVDSFLFPTSYIDITTMGTLSQTSGGDVFFYQNFIAERDAAKFTKDLTHSLYRPQGTAVQMKIRCSTGLKVAAMLGSFLPKGPSDLEMGSVDSDKAVTFVFKHDGKLDLPGDAHFQSAILYTTTDGHRRLRTHNLKCPVGGQIGEVMRYCDAGAVIATVAKLASARILKDEIKQVKQFITDQCVHILAAYRKNCASGVSLGELILPESLKLFPLLSLAIQKQFTFRTDSINSDVRMNNQRLILRASVRDLLSLIYPRLIPLHTLQPTEGFADDQGRFLMPLPIRNTFSAIENGGVYLQDNGQALLLWFKSDVSPQFLQDLYGPEITSLEALHSRNSEVPELPTLLNTQVRNIIAYLNTFSRSRHLVPQLARQGLDGSEMVFAQGLVDDRNCDNMSYSDYLIRIHKQIQIVLAEKQSSKGIGSWLSGTEHAY